MKMDQKLVFFGGYL